MNIIDNEPLHTFTHIYTFDYDFFWSKIGQIRFSKLGKPYFWCATRQVDKLNNENISSPVLNVPGFFM